jgi:hypothetical protein
MGHHLVHSSNSFVFSEVSGPGPFISLGPSLLWGRHNDMVLCCSYCSGSGLKGCGNPGGVQTWGCCQDYCNCGSTSTYMPGTAPPRRTWGFKSIDSGKSLRLVYGIGFATLFWSLLTKIFPAQNHPKLNYSMSSHFSQTPKMARIAL